MARDRLMLFALRGSEDLGAAVGRELGSGLAGHEERDFPDGEHKSRPLVSVRDADVYVLHQLAGSRARSVNDRFCRLLFFLGAVRDAGAARVTAVIPYLCYARKDRRTKPRDPVTTRYVATLFEAMGVDRVVTLDVHNLAAYQNAFRIPAEHLEARSLFARHFAARAGNAPLAVLSPDAGGVKRAEAFRSTLAAITGRTASLAFVEKYRSEGVLSGGTLVGSVRGHEVIVVDDLISSGGTLVRAARACREAGAVGVHAAATHGLFNADAAGTLSDEALDGVVITDAVTVDEEVAVSLGGRLVVLSCAPLLAAAIDRLHRGASLTALDDGAKHP